MITTQSTVTAAVYFRLSSEDDKQSESMSITMQRKIVLERVYRKDTHTQARKRRKQQQNPENRHLLPLHRKHRLINKKTQLQTITLYLCTAPLTPRLPPEIISGFLRAENGRPMVAPTIRAPSISFEIVGPGFPGANWRALGVPGRGQGGMGGSRRSRAKGFPVANIVSNGGSREGWPGVPRKRGTSFWGFTGGDPPFPSAQPTPFLFFILFIYSSVITTG